MCNQLFVLLLVSQFVAEGWIEQNCSSDVTQRTTVRPLWSQPASQPAAANDQRRQRQCETSRLLLFSCLCHWRWKASATAAEINRSDTLRNQQSTDQRWRNRVVTDQQPARLCPIHKETTATKRPVHCAVRTQAQGARGQELLPEVQEKRSTDLGPPES